MLPSSRILRQQRNEQEEEVEAKERNGIITYDDDVVGKMRLIPIPRTDRDPVTDMNGRPQEMGRFPILITGL